MYIVHLHTLLLLFKKIYYCFVAKSTNFLHAKNDENLTSGHLEFAPTLKVQQSSKHPAHIIK